MIGGSGETHARSARPTRRDAAAHGASQRGFTLVELVITIGLMGVISSSMAGALNGVVGHSASTRDASVLDAEVRRAVDAIRATPYIGCLAETPDGPRTGYEAVLPLSDLPAGLAMHVDGVTYWDGNTANPDLSLASCPPGDDQGLQRVTVRVVLGETERTKVVVKRRFQ